MLYQKILTDEMPYQVRVGSLRRFEEHRHVEIEFHYCIRGDLELTVDKKNCLIREGELLVIGPMVAHAVPADGDADQQVLTAIVGPSLLRRHFARFSTLRTSVCDLTASSDIHGMLLASLQACAELCRRPMPGGELMLTGELYRICACLLGELAQTEGQEEREERDLRRVANVERALDLIHYDYARPLTVEEAAAATGYGKSNFCKIFKDVVGESFHRVLNRRRVSNACLLLGESDLPVSAVAQEVGFAECKTFCRVFKEEMGTTPGAYRAQTRGAKG